MEADRTPTQAKQAPSGRKDTTPDLRDQVGCRVVYDVRSIGEVKKLDAGTKEKPRPLELVEVNGLLVSATPLPRFDPNGCKKLVPSSNLEPLLPIFFEVGGHTVLRFPSHIEVALVVIPGFAYYGIPNQIIVSYVRTISTP